MKRRVLATTVGVAALVAASVLAVGAPAQASIAQCGSGRACAWLDPNFAGPFGSWTVSKSSLQSVGFHDNISSVANNRTRQIGWFSDPGYSGSVFSEAPGDGGYFFFLDPRNDSFDSLYLY